MKRPPETNRPGFGPRGGARQRELVAALPVIEVDQGQPFAPRTLAAEGEIGGRRYQVTMTPNHSAIFVEVDGRPFRYLRLEELVRAVVGARAGAGSKP